MCITMLHKNIETQSRYEHIIHLPHVVIKTYQNYGVNASRTSTPVTFRLASLDECPEIHFVETNSDSHRLQF